MKLARDLISQTRISKLLAGYRDRPAADIDGIARALIQVSQMVIDCPEIASLDINPLLADQNGAVALDARIVIDPDRLDETAPNPRLSIRPYPSEWAKRLTTSGGVDVLLRPIRPEDGRLYPAFFEKLDNRDIRLRLLAPRKQFSHEFLARLTQIDYAREMAFVAVNPDSGELYGVSRIVADADYTHAEYAVIVRTDLQARGIGWALMEQLLAYARSEELSLVEGTVLSENSEMLLMCREMGFAVHPDPDDPGCYKVNINLQKPAQPAASPAV
jgi:acetyltransferase